LGSGGRRASAGDAVRLLDERGAAPHRTGGARRCDEIARLHSSGRAVTENESAARLLDRVEMNTRWTRWGLVVENGHGCCHRKEERALTGKSAFTEEEWDLLREAPATAGMMVVTAEGGGTFRETFAMAKAYAEARRQHGESELLDEVVAAGPKRGPRFHSNEELREQALQRLRDAAALLQQKATPEEAQDYRGFVAALAERVAGAHKEGGEQISAHERAAIDEIAASLAPQTS
jgi:hypothetical protein